MSCRVLFLNGFFNNFNISEVNEIVLLKGQQINEVDMGILASLGRTEVLVYSKPIVGFFSTGDELVSINQPLKKSQVYDSNRYLLHGLLQKLSLIHI